MKLVVETTENEIDQQLLDFITIDILKIKQQHPLIQEIITLPMNPIIISSFKKHPMPWEIIHRCLLHFYDSAVKSMYRHQTLDGLPKHCPNKINKSSCKIFYASKMTVLPKGTTVDTSNLKPGELIFMDFTLYKCNFHPWI